MEVILRIITIAIKYLFLKRHDSLFSQLQPYSFASGCKTDLLFNAIIDISHTAITSLDVVIAECLMKIIITA